MKDMRVVAQVCTSRNRSCVLVPERLKFHSTNQGVSRVKLNSTTLCVVSKIHGEHLTTCQLLNNFLGECQMVSRFSALRPHVIDVLERNARVSGIVFQFWWKGAHVTSKTVSASSRRIYLCERGRLLCHAEFLPSLVCRRGCRRCLS